jgi:hypothetical protein
VYRQRRHDRLSFQDVGASHTAQHPDIPKTESINARRDPRPTTGRHTGQGAGAVGDATRLQRSPPPGTA